MQNPKRMKALAFDSQNSQKNNLLHRFVLEHSDSNEPCSERYIAVILRSMSGGTSVNALNGEGYSALHLAVQKKNLFMLRKLLFYIPDIDVNTRSHAEGGYPMTALEYAAKLGHLSIAQELLKEKTKMKYPRGFYLTALFFAAWSGCLDTVKLLMAEWRVGRNFDGFHELFPLQAAARSGGLEVIKYLLNCGADVDSWDEELRTPLHEAARYCGFEAVKLIIERVVVVDVEDFGGRTPLHEAVCHNTFEVVKLILESGGDALTEDSNRVTPLDEALLCGRSEIVDLFKKNIADKNAEREKFLQTLYPEDVEVVFLRYLKILCALMIGIKFTLDALDESSVLPTCLCFAGPYLNSMMVFYILFEAFLFLAF